MKIFRIEREKYLATSLSGIGASLSEGFRWNSAETRLVYTAESRALAMLEIAVHLDLNEDLPKDRFMVEIEIPNDMLILEVKIADLPDLWRAKPPGIFTQTIGDDFVNQNESAILKVPSSIIPQEYNYLINPNHKDFERLEIIAQNLIEFDERLH